MEEWKECKLGDFFELHRGYDLTKSEIKEGPYPVVCSTSIMGYHNEYKVKAPGVVIGRSGTLGEVQFIDTDYWPHNTSLYVSDFKGNSPKFIKYFLQLFGTGNVGGGSAVPTLNRNHLQALTVRVPPLPIQQKISAILSSLDDKIELNNKINTNLEQQAQALFKNWFVDFEPFGGKMPEGWKVGKLGDIVEETLNGDWGKDEPMGTNTEFVYCIRGADIPDVKVGNKGKMPKRYILPKNFESKHLVDGDLVIEISGGSPTQSTGRIAYISQALLNRYEGKMVCTNFCKALKPIQGYQMFMYYYWQYLYERNVFFSYENGTTGIKNLDINGILENEEIAIPTIDALSDFNNFCNSVFMKIFSNGAQSEQLTNVRDTSLPKLMSGEIDVDSVEI